MLLTWSSKDGSIWFLCLRTYEEEQTDCGFRKGAEYDDEEVDAEVVDTPALDSPPPLRPFATADSRSGVFREPRAVRDEVESLART